MSKRLARLARELVTCKVKLHGEDQLGWLDTSKRYSDTTYKEGPYTHLPFTKKLKIAR